MSHMNLATAANYEYDSMEEAWPEVDPEHEPLQAGILFQIRRVKKMTEGGIVLPEQARQAEAGLMQAAKVIAIGPLAFKNPDTLKPWPEGNWVKVGDFVRIPRFNGFRFSVKWK